MTTVITTVFVCIVVFYLIGVWAAFLVLKRLNFEMEVLENDVYLPYSTSLKSWWFVYIHNFMAMDIADEIAEKADERYFEYLSENN